MQSIGISEDVAYSKVPISSLDKELTTSLPEDDPTVQAQALEAITEKLEAANSPVIIVDGGAARGSWDKYVAGLIDALKVPFFTTVIGKGIVNEHHSLYGGPYAGAACTVQDRYRRPTKSSKAQTALSGLATCHRISTRKLHPSSASLGRRI